MATISYAITACNEHVELKRLLNFLKENKQKEDEVIIQLDEKHTPEVEAVCKEYDFKYYSFPLNNNFAAFKNNLTKSCTKQYIFQIDADEIPEEYLINVLPALLDDNLNVDVFLTPRINTVEGLTQEHVKRWGWNVNEKGWVNYPDYQWRIYKNSSDIQWINRVHERLIGFKEFAYIPEQEGYNLLHPKTIERQERQNQYYSSL
jgi:glycosyltransferase involved in cell wall biosynthesis